MGFIVDPKVKVGNNRVLDFNADTEADVADLPTEEGVVDIGSSCLVIETGDVYILDTTRTWSPIGG